MLADRARLEHAAGERPGMAGIREEPDYATWRQRAGRVIRTGAALLARGNMAPLLAAEPGRCDALARTAAWLRDTLVLDDRAQTLARHGANLDRSAGRRVRTFARETIPAVLADRARLEHTAGERPGMVGMQEEPDYATWRQRADLVIRTGAALLAGSDMAPLLAAERGGRDALDRTTAWLRDTLDLDDRAHIRLLRDRDGIHPGDAAGAGSPPATAPFRSVPTALRELVETAARLRSRQPVLPAPASARLAPGPGASGVDGPVPVASTPAPSGTLPPPIAALLRDAVARRARRLAKLLAEDLPRLQSFARRREEIRRAAVDAGGDVSAQQGHDRWRAAASGGARRARTRLDRFEPWLEAHDPASSAAAAARHHVNGMVATLAGALARDATAAGYVLALRRHAEDAVAADKSPYTGSAYADLVEEVRDFRNASLPGECPPILAAVADRPEALQAGHARVWQLGTRVLPGLEAALGTRDELCQAAHAQESGVTEMPGYGDWDRQAEAAARAAPAGSAPDDPVSAWHWHIVHRSPQGARARERLAAVTHEVARAVRIDRAARALLADPLRPADPANPPWAEPARAADVPRYEDYVKRIRTLHTGADRPGEMPPALPRTAEAFETWMGDRAVVAKHAATIRSGLRRSRQLLAGASNRKAPFRDDGSCPNWLGELGRIQQATTPLRRDLPRYRPHMDAIGLRDSEFRAGGRITDLLPHLDRTPAGRLLQLHDAIATAPARPSLWLQSAAAGSVVDAWQRISRNDPGGARTGARTPPPPIRHLKEGRALHRHADEIRTLAKGYRDMGADEWLVDPTDSTWPDQVGRKITAAQDFVRDPRHAGAP